MSYRKLLFTILFLLAIDSYASVVTVSTHVHDMEFRDLARKWDEAIPLGNATIGSLIWQKGERLRMSIDRSDLWDLRHSKELEGEGFSFHWLYEQLQKGDYTPVQRRFDNPYNAYPGPSKIPGAGLEFPIEHFGEVEKVHLYQRQAVCEVVWKSGVSLRCFVHAQKPVGWFIFEGVEADFEPLLIPPSYNEEVRHTAEDHSQHSLFRLGYEQGKVERTLSDKFVYNQPGWGDFSYSVAVKWKRFGEKIIGVWSVTSSLVKEEASQIVDEAMNAGIEAYYQTHQNWWNIFYSRSSVTLPDKVIEKQLFRIIQEVLHNAIRHGKASIIQVKLTVHKRQIRLVIIDNGIGFDPNNLPASSRQHGFGLVSLYERVALINGHLQLSSRVNEGTKIVIILPYKKVDNKT